MEGEGEGALPGLESQGPLGARLQLSPDVFALLTQRSGDRDPRLQPWHSVPYTLHPVPCSPRGLGIETRDCRWDAQPGRVAARLRGTRAGALTQDWQRRPLLSSPSAHSLRSSVSRSPVLRSSPAREKKAISVSTYLRLFPPTAAADDEDEDEDEGDSGGYQSITQMKEARRAAREAARKKLAEQPPPLLVESWQMAGGVQGLADRDSKLCRDTDGAGRWCPGLCPAQACSGHGCHACPAAFFVASPP